MIIPNRLTMFMVWPLAIITASVARMATGIPTATQNATGALRNMKRINHDEH